MGWIRLKKSKGKDHVTYFYREGTMTIGLRKLKVLVRRAYTEIDEKKMSPDEVEAAGLANSSLERLMQLLNVYIANKRAANDEDLIVATTGEVEKVVEKTHTEKPDKKRKYRRRFVAQCYW